CWGRRSRRPPCRTCPRCCGPRSAPPRPTGTARAPEAGRSAGGLGPVEIGEGLARLGDVEPQQGGIGVVSLGRGGVELGDVEARDPRRGGGAQEDAEGTAVV